MGDSFTRESACNCLSVREAARLLTDYYDDCLEPTGLRMSQFAVLATLEQSGTMSVNQLADALSLDRTTMGKNLLPLIRDGYVAMSVGADRRVRLAALTKSGTAIARRAEKYWQAAQADFERANGVDKMGRLRQTLATLVVPQA